MSTDSFIVRFWSTIFSWLKWISVFQFIRKLNPKLVTYRFVDAWVLGNLIFSIVSVWIVHYAQSNIVKYVVLIYGLVRVFEIIVYQINVLLFDEYRAKDNYQLLT